MAVPLPAAQNSLAVFIWCGSAGGFYHISDMGTMWDWLDGHFMDTVYEDPALAGERCLTLTLATNPNPNPKP